MKHIILDTETTDVGWGARLVQLAYKVLESGEEINEYFKPPVPISFDAMAVHHITNEMVIGKPYFEDSPVKEGLQKFLIDGILIAHNAPYDMGILYHEGITTSHYIDTVRVSKHILKSPRYGLQYLRYSLGLSVSAVAHDAYGDVLILEKLFAHLSDVVRKEYSLTDTESIDQKMFELTQTPVLLNTIRFGKYNGKSFEEISKEDSRYLGWLLGSESNKKESEQDEELIYTLKYYLEVE